MKLLYWLVILCFCINVVNGAGRPFIVALSPPLLLVGIPTYNGNTGIVYIFMEIGQSGHYSFYDFFSPPNLNAGDRFGASLSLDVDLVIGAPGTNNGFGAVYMWYNWQMSNGSINPNSMMTKIPAPATASPHGFGTTVKTILDAFLTSGDDRSWVYTLNSNSQWNLAQTWTGGASTGWISRDRIVLGYPKLNQARVYLPNPDVANTWELNEFLFAPTSDQLNFGQVVFWGWRTFSVGDFSIVVASPEGNKNGGAINVYMWNCTECVFFQSCGDAFCGWELKQIIKGTPAFNGDMFGSVLALNGNTMCSLTGNNTVGVFVNFYGSYQRVRTFYGDGVTGVHCNSNYMAIAQHYVVDFVTVYKMQLDGSWALSDKILLPNGIENNQPVWSEIP